MSIDVDFPQAYQLLLGEKGVADGNVGDVKLHLAFGGLVGTALCGKDKRPGSLY